MTYYAKTGSFNIDVSKTAGQDQIITGVGFQPKIVLFWWGGYTGTEDTVEGGDIKSGFGAAINSTHRYTNAFGSRDNQATSSGFSISTTTDVIRTYSTGGTVSGYMDFSSMDADGFTLTVDDQFDYAYRINYLAIGGTELTDVYIGSVNVPITTGSWDITDAGFQPDALIISYGGPLAFQHQLAVGITTGSSNQLVVNGGIYSGGVTMQTRGYNYDGEVYAHQNISLNIDVRESFISFLPNGFRLNHLEGSITKTIYYIALKGGNYLVGNITTRTDSNDITVSGLAFKPSAILFMSANRALSTQDILTEHNRLSIGAATSTSERTCMAISDEDALADSETAYGNYNSAVYANILDDAIVGLMDLKSMDAGGFTCIMDDTDPTGCFVGYLAMGGNPVEGSVCWGHTDEVQEGNVRTFAGNWIGTGVISGSGDYEKILLSTGNYMQSEVVNTGANRIELSQNKYDSSGSGLLKYRSGSSAINCGNAEWQNYSGSFTSTGYAQIKIEPI